MGISRSDAIKRLEALLQQVEGHLRKIADEPESQAVPHWKGEIEVFLRRMEDLLPHVGKRTSAEWATKIEKCRAALEEK